MKRICLLLVAGLLAGKDPAQLSESERYRWVALRDPAFRPLERIGHYRRYDFTPLLRQQVNPVGFIGPHCQRLRIKLLSVRRNATDSACYLLTGKTQVLGHVAAFSGTLVLRHARELRRLAPNGEAASTATMQAFKSARREGFVLGDYELRENSVQPKNGVFQGVVRINWYVDKQDHLHYDYVYGEGDGFCNNQFVGTWTSYATGRPLRCNWGDFRIPNAGDFDSGAGEFSPADKYLPYGWQDIRNATSPDEAQRVAAARREAQQWWR